MIFWTTSCKGSGSGERYNSLIAYRTWPESQRCLCYIIVKCKPPLSSLVTWARASFKAHYYSTGWATCQRWLQLILNCTNLDYCITRFGHWESLLGMWAHVFTCRAARYLPSGSQHQRLDNGRNSSNYFWELQEILWWPHSWCSVTQWKLVRICPPVTVVQKGKSLSPFS